MPTTLEYVRPWLYNKQHEAIFCPTRYALVEASTKSGKTVGCLVWFTEQALQGKLGQNFWWVAPSHSQAKMAFQRLRHAIPRQIIEPNETDLTLKLLNGAILWFKTGEKPDLLYGEDVYAAVVDEASRLRDEAWHALRSTLTATRGPVRLIGNVKGRKNWFYALCRRAEGGAPNMHYAKLTWKDAVEAGVLQLAEVEDAKAQLPESVFQELYAAEPSEDGGNPFGIQHIDQCTAPLSKKAPKIWGWDLARAHDYTVGIALDDEGYVCRLERWHEDWEPTMLKIQAHISNTPAWIEQNGVGDAPVQLLQKGHSNIHGFLTTAPSKQAIMERLAVAIQQHDVHFPEGILASELRSFEFESTRTGVRYSAPEGCFDDCVMALAIAWHAFDRTTPQVVPVGVEQQSKWVGLGALGNTGRKWGGT